MLTWGGSKIAKKVMTYFMDGPLARQAGNERRVSSFCTVYATYVTSSADRAVHTGSLPPARRTLRRWQRPTSTDQQSS